MKDRKTREELRELVGVEPITPVIKSGRKPTVISLYM